jgi:hypothetical protein
MLAAFLDLYRTVLVRKVEGLDGGQLRFSPVGSGTSLGGLIKHCRYVEQWWFATVYDHQELVSPFPAETDGDFRVESDETSASLIAQYQAECERSRAVVDKYSDLDQTVPASRGRTISRRWILMHMLEEVSRHAGHADIIREMIDGAVGD